MQLLGLTANQRSILLDAISEQLVYQPTVETKNRKLMRENILATWELRVGQLRVYYDVIDEPEQLVSVEAIGVKMRNQVYFNGEPFEL